MAYSFSTQQAANAETIVRVGLGMGASLTLIRAALAAAWVESRWQNLNYGDRDSLGLFQQRPSQGWGTAAQVTNPTYAATKFFQGAFKVSQSGTVGQIAQRVQRSAFPSRYDEQIGAADEILARFARSGGELAASLARVGVSIANAVSGAAASVGNFAQQNAPEIGSGMIAIFLLGLGFIILLKRDG